MVRSLKSLLQGYVDRHGLAPPKAKVAAEGIVREALERQRPDLVIFFLGARRTGGVVTVKMSHPAAAQEGALIAADLLRAVRAVLGAGSVKAVRFVAAEPTEAEAEAEEG